MEAKLTIIMPTYNREDYIKEALDSILMQETSYPYEIAIADDCSTDNSLKIAQEYKEKYPNIIKILTSQINQKLFKNIVRVYADLKTDYFCVLDPDDFWTDKHKIQKALDFLESHKDFTAYFGNTAFQYEIKGYNTESERPDFYHNCPPCESTFEKWLKKGKLIFGHTSSCIFRNVLFKSGLPEALSNATGTQEQSYRADSFRNMSHLQKGKFYYSGEVDSVYRVASSGIWSSLTSCEQNLINAIFWKDMWLYFDKKYIQLLITSQSFYCKYSTIEYINSVKFEKSRERESYLQLVDRISQCKELEDLYRENALSIAHRPNIKIKNKIYLWIYNKLQKKLLKKGLIWD